MAKISREEKKLKGTYRKDKDPGTGKIIEFDEEEIIIPNGLQKIPRAKAIFIEIVQYLKSSGNYKNIDRHDVSNIAKLLYWREKVSDEILQGQAESISVNKETKADKVSPTWVQWMRINTDLPKMLQSYGIGPAGRKALDIALSKTKTATIKKVALR